MSKIINRLPAKLKAKTIKVQIDSDYISEYADGLGFLPFIWYNAYPIDLKDVGFFELSIVDNLPTLKLTFLDGINMMRDRGFPLDDTIISIFINPRSTQLKPIHLDFKIVDFKIVVKDYTCVGVLNVSRLFISEFKSYKNSSSYQLLYDLCNDVGLGFNSNVESTNDKMTWINTGDKVRYFLDKVIDNSYISDQSFVLGYIDYYYNYNYVDLQKELTRNLEQEYGIMDTGIQKVLNSPDKEIIGKLLLTNDVAYLESNNYFEQYTVTNKSTGISIVKGYKSIIKYYNQLSKEYLSFDLDSITDNSNSKIILKGAPKDTKFKNENLDYIYKGKLDSDNMHINYAYAQIHNDRNLIDLEKIGLEIIMGTPNYNLYKFQKILIAISNQSRNLQEEFYNKRLSGEWLIVDIKYRITEQKFKQIITLVKRELELSKNELET